MTRIFDSFRRDVIIFVRSDCNPGIPNREIPAASRNPGIERPPISGFRDRKISLKLPNIVYNKRQRAIRSHEDLTL